MSEKDARLIAVIMRLSEDLANMEKALARTQEVLRALIKETRQAREMLPPDKQVPALQAFLAQQQPRLDGTFPKSAWIRPLPRENDEEQ